VAGRQLTGCVARACTWPLRRHIFVDNDGIAPLTLNTWERQVMKLKIFRGEALFWLRNVGARICLNG